MYVCVCGVGGALLFLFVMFLVSCIVILLVQGQKTRMNC